MTLSDLMSKVKADPDTEDEMDEDEMDFAVGTPGQGDFGASGDEEESDEDDLDKQVTFVNERVWGLSR